MLHLHDHIAIWIRQKYFHHILWAQVITQNHVELYLGTYVDFKIHEMLQRSWLWKMMAELCQECFGGKWWLPTIKCKYEVSTVKHKKTGLKSENVLGILSQGLLCSSAEEPLQPWKEREQFSSKSKFAFSRIWSRCKKVCSMQGSYTDAISMSLAKSLHKSLRWQTQGPGNSVYKLKRSSGSKLIIYASLIGRSVSIDAVAPSFPMWRPRVPQDLLRPYVTSTEDCLKLFFGSLNHI